MALSKEVYKEFEDVVGEENICADPAIMPAYYSNDFAAVILPKDTAEVYHSHGSQENEQDNRDQREEYVRCCGAVRYFIPVTGRTVQAGFEFLYQGCRDQLLGHAERSRTHGSEYRW